VQIDPIKHTLTPPETKRLILKCGEALSDFAFNFNLRRYTVEEPNPRLTIGSLITFQLYFNSVTSSYTALSSCLTSLGRVVQVDPVKRALIAPGTKRLKLKYDEPLSFFAFNFNLRRYS
jgi:hypothetical protein